MKNKNKQVGKYLSMNNLRCAQRRRLNEEMVNLSVFLARWFQAEELHYTDEYRRARCMETVRQILGGPDGPGLLQQRINEEMDGILDRLQADFPKLQTEELLVYSYSMAGFTNNLSARLAGLRRDNAVSVIRNRLRTRIRLSGSPYMEEYLTLLPNKGCRFGEEMLYLHNLK